MANKQPISNPGGQSVRETDMESATFESSDVPSIRKKYSCEYCSKSFSRSGHLSMHRRTHTGERPFVCQYCSRAFTQSSALYRHHKTCAKSPNKGKPEPLSKTTSVHQVSSTVSKQKETDSPISGHSFSAPTIYGGFSDKDNASDNDNDDIDDDIMFVCCDHTFTSSADYDKHVRSQHSKSQPDSFIPHCSTERDTVLSTPSNKLLLNSHIVNKADFNLYPTYSPASEHINDIGSIHNTQDNGQEPGIIYLLNMSSDPDTVTINLSDHSVSNSCSSNSRNASFLDDRSNSGIKLVASKPTVPSSDFINDYDYSEKQQINKFVSSMKPDLKPASRFSQPVLGVPHKSPHSEASHINNLSNGLLKTPAFASIKTKASNPLKNSMESVVNSKEVKSSCIPTFSSHGRLKTSRLQSCQFCPRQFTRTSHLTQHLRTHTGERPFQCEYCGNAFTQTSALNRHLKTCHVAQSVNSNVAGNATFQPQPLSSFPISSDFEASHEICYPYQDCEVVFPQPVPVDSYRKDMHADGINPEITIQTSSSPMHMPLSYQSDSSDSNSTSKVHFNAYSKSHIPKSKSCLAKMKERSIENQLLQSKRKPLFQKIVKSNKKFCCDVCSVEFLSRQHLMLHMRKHLQPNSTSLKTTAKSQSRNHLPSSLVWAPSSRNKNLFRNKVYNTFNHKRTFEKHKSMSFASNAHPSSTLARPKTNSFFKKHPRFVSSSEESKLKDLSKKKKLLSKSLQARNLKNHSEEFIVTLNLSEESTKDSVLSDRSESPKNLLYSSDSSFQRVSKISTTVYTCDICTKSFYSDLLFRIHRSTHSLEKKKKKNSLTTSAKNRDPAGFNPTPTFETPSTSSDQMRKTFPCVYCHKTFLRHSHLETHVRTHTGEKPFQCESCGRAFSQSSARNRHIKTCFMAKQILNTGLLTAESLTSTNISQSTTTVINALRNLDDSSCDVTLLNYDQPRSTSNAVQAHNPNESPSKYPMPSKETCVGVTPLGLQLKLPNSEEVKGYESGDSYSHQTTNQSSVNPIKDRKVIGNELKFSKPEQECRNEGSGSAECLQIISRSEQQSPSFVEKIDDETNDLETMIFDSALQVVHDSLQMKSEYSLTNDCSITKKESATSQAMLGSPDWVSDQNCPDPSDICPSPLDIPQPNVTLSLGSEFVDLMDTDSPNISHTISTRQEEEEETSPSSVQKDVYPDYSPETPPPFVSEYLSPKDAATDKPLAEVIEVSSSSSSSSSVCGVIQRNINSGGIDKSYPCNYCGEIFSNSDLLNNHEKSHTAVKFFCASCSDGFTDASALGKHLPICVAARKESSKEPVSVTDICLSHQGLQMPKIDENINEKRESGKASELEECQSSSSLFNARQTNVDQGNNLEKTTLKNWPLKLFSDEGTVKSSELKDSFSDCRNAKSMFDHSSGKTYNIRSSKDSSESCSDDQGAVGMETDCQTLTRKLTCPYCDLDFSSSNQLDEHVSCHVSEKPYICWFCKESYVLSSDFEQHMKICGAPATFPNLSSPNSSKGESNNEDDDNNSKFTDVALFTPITVTANLSDCDDDDADDERGGGGNETDVPLAWNHSKDKINSSKLSSYQIQDPGTGSQSKNMQEKDQDFAETFKSVEIFSNQLQINNPNQLVSIPDTSREFSLDSGSSAKDLMVENLTYPGENMKQSPKNNTNLNESPKKEVQDINDKCSMADSTPEEITKELRVYEYPKNLSSEFLESQEALKDEPFESIVFLCCHQTYTSAQDYNEHLLNFHAEHTDNKNEEPREKQVPQPSKISKAEALNGYRDRSSQNKRLLINNDPLTLNRYVCQFCTRGFSRSGHLIQHMRTHTGERPYPCQFCSKAFTQSSALNRHWKTCPKAKLFYNDGVKRTSAGYCVTLPGFQKSSEGNGKSGSRNISPLPVQLFENQTRNKSFSAGNNLLNSSPFGNIDEISCDKTNDGITKCEHCGLKFLKLNDFIQHSNTCSSADKVSFMDGTFHQEVQSFGTRNQDKLSKKEIPNNCLQQITIKENKNEDAQFSNIEIKKEALEVVFECDFCHKLFSDELEMVRHQESECLQNEPLNWNLAENLENRETTNTIKPEEIFPFTCCEEMFFDLKTYHIHRETHHSLKEHQNYNALCQGDDQMKQRLNSNVKTEVDLQNQICYDIYLNSKSYSDSSPEIGQLSSVPKSKLDNAVGKRASDEHSELPSVDRSTGLDNISRFQVLESSNSVSESQALISANDKKNYGIESDSVISPSQETQKSSSAKDITQGHDTTLNWLQWENYISQQLNISNPNRTAVVASQEKKYACDYCDKKFTRSGHLVMHRRTHTGERPFSCSHCHKAFTQSSALNRHLKTCNLARLASTSHLGTKSPTSELICCGINFHWAGALNVHLVTHNIYKCHICNQDFENFDLLLIHIKSHASQEQTPVSNSQGQFIDNHCDFCPVSFQSVVEQLIHMKTEHWTKSSEKLTSNNQVSSNPDNIPKLSCLSSKTEYSKPDNSSENSNGSSTKNSLESSSSFILNQPKRNFLSRTKIGKISRVKRLAQSTSLRIPSKQSIYFKYQQNKQYPSSTSLKRRPSTFLSEPKSVRSLEFSTPNTSMRSALNHNLRRAIKRAVNNSSKPHTLPEQYTSLFGTLSPTKAKDQQSAIFGSTDIPLSQTDGSNNILARILLNNHSNRKLMVKREKNDSHVYPNKTQSANSEAECDKDDNFYDEGQFDNNSDGLSYEAISSVINTFQLDKSSSQTKQYLHSDVSCLPNLKIQPSNLIALKRSLLNSGNLKSTTEVNVTAGKAEQLLLKTIKYQKEPNLFVSIDSSSSSSSDFVCPICQKSFTCSSHLNSHIQTHTEEWPYVCIHCNRCFQRENALERHLKNCAVGNSKTLVQPSCSVVSNSRINEFFTDASSTDKKITFVSAAVDKQNLAETIFESQQNHVDVTKNGAITPDVRNRALSVSFSPGKSDNELSIAAKIQSGCFNLQNSQQPNKIGETISLSKVSPCTDTKDDENKKEYKESVMAATESNTNPSQIQEVQCQSNKSFLKTNGSKQNPPQTLCSPQQTLHSSGFDRYIVKIEPGSEDVKSYDALSEMSDLQNSFNISTIGKLSDTSKEKLKNYSHNDKLPQPDDQSDPTLYDSANKPKTKDPDSTLESFDQSGVSLSQNGPRTLQDSACTTSVVPKKKKNSHVCRKCGQIFPQFFDLFQHNCPRSAERYSFTCEYCDKSFSRHSHLITHRRTHTGERPYQCCYCQRSFTQTSALNRHQKTCSFIPAHLKTKIIKTTLSGSSNSL